tara:strand:+ start:2983 stop:3216 length:234 start_codon:yes stop_codon:yes gene_type:complete
MKMMKLNYTTNLDKPPISIVKNKEGEPEIQINFYHRLWIIKHRKFIVRNFCKSTFSSLFIEEIIDELTQEKKEKKEE